MTITPRAADNGHNGTPSPIAAGAMELIATDIPIVVFDAGVGNGKQCGNLVGDAADPDGKWYEHATADPAVITGWLAEHGPRATGIATSPGKADAVVLDIDRPELVPDDWWPLLEDAPYQSTDANDPRHGHYWFDLPPGERFGNPEFPWGEVRCDGGGLILAPTPHARANQGGRYKWMRVGETPPLPEPIAAALRAKDTDHQGRGVVTDAQIDAWLDSHTGNDFPNALEGIKNRFGRQVDSGEKRHDAMQAVLAWSMCESAANAYPARRAHDELKALWDKEKPEATAREWRDMVRWAIGQAEADDRDKRRERMTREYGSHHTDAINAEVTSPDFDFEAFWESSDQLRDLRQFARARMVGPWAMLGATLARVVAVIPPHVVLPPIVGSEASLNTFVALVGRSGESKSASMRASADWMTVEPDYPPLKPGSGEGLAKCFAYKRRLPNNGGWMQIGKQWSVLAQIPEVDTLSATSSRGGSTIMSTLREGWSGERLGQDYAGDDKRIVLQEHRYRLCLVVGVQPLRAQPLFEDADGGTPQRFVWFPAVDPDMPDVEPPEPAKLDLGRWETKTKVIPASTLDETRNIRLDNPVDRKTLEVLAVPDWIEADIRATRREINKGNVDPIDGHRKLVQLKIAAALMTLEGRRQAITDSDWHRAAVVMAVSDRTRQSVIDALRKQKTEVNVSRARFEGERAHIADEIKANRTVERVADYLLKVLREKFSGEASRSDLRRKIASRDRAYFDNAEAWLVENGKIKQIAAENVGGTDRGVILKLTEDSQ